MPLPAACRCDTASIQRSRDFPQGRSPGLLCLSDDGQHVGSEPIGLGCHGFQRALTSHRELGVTKGYPRAFAAASAWRVRVEISARSFSARAANRWSTNGSTSGPNSAAQKGTL